MKKGREDILFFEEETNTWRPILLLKLRAICGIITTIKHLLTANSIGTQSTSSVLMEAFCYGK